MDPTARKEAESVTALHDLDVLEARLKPYFDAVCRTASALFGVPVACVSMMEGDRHRFLAKCGIDREETQRDGAFCTEVLRSDAVFVVEDAAADPRFRHNPLVVGPPHARFYAGAPLDAEAGRRVGALCVLDGVPRSFSPADRARLRDLAAIASAQLSLHRAEARLRLSETHYRLLAENTSDMVIWATLDSVRRYVSPACRTLLGYEAEELIGTKPLDQVHPADAEAYGRVLADLCDERLTQTVSTQRYRRKDGTWIWVEINFNLTYDSGAGRPNGYVATVRDISARKEAEFRIAHMARHDALTDLANRTLFRERLTQELGVSHRRGTGFAVLCLDLDRFKSVNDTHGHHAGDALLRIVAGRLRGVVRTEDTIARIGGDEFMILQTGPVAASSIRSLARRLIEVVSQPVDLDGTVVAVGVSVGVAVAPQDGDAPDLLCRNADIALFQAKGGGRNTFRLYEPGMRFGPG